MSIPSAADVANRWIEKWAAPDGPRGESDGFDLDWELPWQYPRLCLDAILQVLSQIPADPAGRHFQVLAAGPLEDLLRLHGSEHIDEIETLARQRPAFRLLLNGVWTTSIAQDVAERLEKYRTAQW
jgi:hypothetical protein